MLSLARKLLGRIRSAAHTRRGIFVTNECRGYTSGLGNKMLALATGYSQAKRMGVPLRVEACPTWGSNSVTGKTHFKESDVAARLGLPTTIMELFPRIEFVPVGSLSGQARSIYHERDPAQWHEIPREKSLLLDGYFFRSRYFAAEKNALVGFLAPAESVTRYMEEKYRALLAAPFVAVHIRRTDYSALNKAEPNAYFLRAAQLFPRETRFALFSDDPAALSEVQTILAPHSRNVDLVTGEPNYVDLFLMGRGVGNILSDSSFGFWSTFLRTGELAKVIAPAKMILREDHWISP